ncbi:hypothetical protein A5791_21655 [Mycobacterium sp. 852002-51163_SCH5372311]|uniref:hypothetical protein n=1 Tax=Mycobacterium sp. 852002-51163_SCH5372311 TaxID=1834097 RepID=UPI0008010C89|nr:hypothetical protein [Mycobacterium sp. 852002-51163_SCH5372311]OBF86007.1 hypothetical protein A5791_21655 [Mycobacterium sp. 852002-51163_SCH5372311]
MRSRDLLLRLGIAVSLVVSAVSHAHLYRHGYQHIPNIGDGFLVQASVSFALALLILVGGPAWLRWAAAAVAGGSVVAFAMSRTVGVAGFVEQGWDPSPYAALSLGAELATVVLCIAGRLIVNGRFAIRRAG